jgi:hypothetical protein
MWVPCIMNNAGRITAMPAAARRCRIDPKGSLVHRTCFTCVNLTAGEQVGGSPGETALTADHGEWQATQSGILSLTEPGT